KFAQPNFSEWRKPLRRNVASPQCQTQNLAFRPVSLRTPVVAPKSDTTLPERLKWSPPVNTILQRILGLAPPIAFPSPILRSEQPQKASRSTQEDRIKKLEERADAGEKAASAAAMEKDYIARTQKLYESYYQKTFNIQLGTLVIVGLL